jgi:hypothetical protein
LPYQRTAAQGDVVEREAARPGAVGGGVLTVDVDGR